ncbi:50S ribosomal protein L3 [Patescibacteria group bacterium]
MSFILARKLKMTSIFDDQGGAVSVTVLEAGPCVITQVKEQEKDGYTSVQVGFGESKKINKPMKGHLKDMKQFKVLREFRLADLTEMKKGDEIKVDQFKKGDTVHVSGVSKGKGFAGVIKRHNFSRGPETHGSRHHREPGSIGSMFPQHVVKGRKLPGQLGNARNTIQNLEVVDVDIENNLVVIKGAIPGHYGNCVEIIHTATGKQEQKNEN